MTDTQPEGGNHDNTMTDKERPKEYQVTVEGYEHYYVSVDEVEDEEEAKQVAYERARTGDMTVSEIRTEGPY